MRSSGSDDAISGVLNLMFDSMFDDNDVFLSLLQSDAVEFFGLVVLAQPCTVLVGRSVSDAPLVIPVRCVSFLREHRSPDG